MFYAAMDNPCFRAGDGVPDAKRSNIIRAAHRSFDVGNRGVEEGEHKIKDLFRIVARATNNEMTKEHVGRQGAVCQNGENHAI